MRRLLHKLLITISLFFCLSALAQAATTLNFEVNGVKDDLLTNVNARLSALKQTYGATLSREEVLSIYNQAPQEIKQALQPFGYFRAKITSHLIQSNDTYRAQFSIQLGAPLRIHDVDVRIAGEGRDNKKIQSFIKKFPLKPGDVFAVQAYEKAKEQLFLTANNEGYVKATLEQNNVLIDLKKYRADIILHLETGPRYYFGPVTFENDQYASSFLQRFELFKAEEPFSSQKLITFQQDLASSYYFQQVTVTPDFENAVGNIVPIKVRAAAPKSQRYNVGIGYGTTTGARFTAGVSLRRLTDTGQHFDAQLKLSSVLSGVVGKYYIPGKNPLTDQWMLGVNYQRFLPKNGSSSSGTLTAGYIKKFKNWQASANINYLLERFKVVDTPTVSSHLLYPSVNFSYSHADDLLHPKSGKSLTIILQGASKAALSSTSFLQGEIKGKYLYSPFDFAHILLRADIGYTAVKDINQLPLSMRFFAGGNNSIRGYRDSSIGPGRYLQVYSAEYQNHLVGNWTGAVFYDFGTASNYWDTAFSKSQGLGIIYQSMIGPIKLYAAQAVSRKGKPWGLEFSIGPEF